MMRNSILAPKGILLATFKRKSRMDFVVILLALLQSFLAVEAFVVGPFSTSVVTRPHSFASVAPTFIRSKEFFLPSRITTKLWDAEENENDDWDVALDANDSADEKDEVLTPSSTPQVPLDGMERAWRYAKKPLLRIGSKGATLSHGNSLFQLLEQHTVVKVKVNTRRFNDSLEEAFETLRGLAEENGAPKGIELLQARNGDKIILFGWPGTQQRIIDGSFPVPEEQKEDKADDDA